MPMTVREHLGWIYNHILNGHEIPREDLLWLVRRAIRWEADSRALQRRRRFALKMMKAVERLKLEGGVIDGQPDGVELSEESIPEVSAGQSEREGTGIQPGLP